MSISMLDYTKMILSKVSFDAKLFKKEFDKAVKKLLPTEIQDLIEWIRVEFQGQNVLSVVGL
jgi:hypothetical protein